MSSHSITIKDADSVIIDDDNSDGDVNGSLIFPLEFHATGLEIPYDHPNKLSSRRRLSFECLPTRFVVRNESEGIMLNVTFESLMTVKISAYHEGQSLAITLILKSSVHGVFHHDPIHFINLKVRIDPCGREPYDQMVSLLKKRVPTVEIVPQNDVIVGPTSPDKFYGTPTKAKRKTEAQKDGNFVSRFTADKVLSIPANRRPHRSVNYHSFKSPSADIDEENIIDDDNLDPGIQIGAEILSECVPLSEQVVFRPSLHYKMDSKTTMVITNNDFKCLYNGNWVNDSIVDFFLNYDFKLAKEAGKLDKYRIEIFNSFFFSQLTRDSASPDNCYLNVKNWFKSNDSLFDNDYVVIPIMADLHWFCVIVGNLPKVRKSQLKQGPQARHEETAHTNTTDHSMTPMEVDDDDRISLISSNSQEIPKEKGLLPSNEDTREYIHLYVMDSLRKVHPNVALYLKKFLIGYAKDKYGLDLDTQGIKHHRTAIPQQKNFNDCGLHVIYNINIFFNDPETFRERVLMRRRRARNSDMFDPEARKNMRKSLRDTLIGLLIMQVKAKGEDASMIGKETNKMVNQKDSLTSIDGKKDMKLNDDGEDDDLIIVEKSPVPERLPVPPTSPPIFPVTMKISSNRLKLSQDSYDGDNKHLDKVSRGPDNIIELKEAKRVDEPQSEESIINIPDDDKEMKNAHGESVATHVGVKKKAPAAEMKTADEIKGQVMHDDALEIAGHGRRGGPFTHYISERLRHGSEKSVNDKTEEELRTNRIVGLKKGMSKKNLKAGILKEGNIIRIPITEGDAREPQPAVAAGLVKDLVRGLVKEAFKRSVERSEKEPVNGSVNEPVRETTMEHVKPVQELVKGSIREHGRPYPNSPHSKHIVANGEEGVSNTDGELEVLKELEIIPDDETQTEKERPSERGLERVVHMGDRHLRSRHRVNYNEAQSKDRKVNPVSTQAQIVTTRAEKERLPENLGDRDLNMSDDEEEGGRQQGKGVRGRQTGTQVDHELNVTPVKLTSESRTQASMDSSPSKIRKGRRRAMPLDSPGSFEPLELPNPHGEDHENINIAGRELSLLYPKETQVANTTNVSSPFFGSAKRTARNGRNGNRSKKRRVGGIIEEVDSPPFEPFRID